jgi:uncharacterized sporulation protein YeaH/YhbH (DUF444 family)
MKRCMGMLQNDILPLCQYYAYIEVHSDEQIAPFLSVVWSGYDELTGEHENFAMRRVSSPGEIYPVFRELFSASG